MRTFIVMVLLLSSLRRNFCVSGTSWSMNILTCSFSTSTSNVLLFVSLGVIVFIRCALAVCSRGSCSMKRCHETSSSSSVRGGLSVCCVWFCFVVCVVAWGVGLFVMSCFSLFMEVPKVLSRGSGVFRVLSWGEGRGDVWFVGCCVVVVVCVVVSVVCSGCVLFVLGLVLVCVCLLNMGFSSFSGRSPEEGWSSLSFSCDSCMRSSSTCSRLFREAR